MLIRLAAASLDEDARRKEREEGAAGTNCSLTLLNPPSYGPVSFKLKLISFIHSMRDIEKRRERK